MTGRGVFAVALAIAGGGTLGAGQPQTPAQQTFRTGADVVLVDVAVREGGRAVTGLQAEDFVLTDNGVRQRIDGVVSTAVPIDLTLVVDLSGIPGRPWTPSVPASKTMVAVEEEVGEVARMLRPNDRLRVLAIDTRVAATSAHRARSPETKAARPALSIAIDAASNALTSDVTSHSSLPGISPPNRRRSSRSSSRPIRTSIS